MSNPRDDDARPISGDSGFARRSHFADMTKATTRSSIVGPNRAKSTLLNLASSSRPKRQFLDRPDRGAFPASRDGGCGPRSSRPSSIHGPRDRRARPRVVSGRSARGPRPRSREAARRALPFAERLRRSARRRAPARGRVSSRGTDVLLLDEPRSTSTPAISGALARVRNSRTAQARRRHRIRPQPRRARRPSPSSATAVVRTATRRRARRPLVAGVRPRPRRGQSRQSPVRPRRGRPIWMQGL